MAIRLPQKQYRGVQSLGRHDIYAPIRTARAVGHAAMSVANVAETWAKAEAGEQAANAVADYKTRVNQLRTDVTSQDVLDVKKYKEAGVDVSEENSKYIRQVKDPVTGQTKEVIPSWRVAGQVYDIMEQKIREDVTKDLPGVSRKAFTNQITDYQISTANAVVSKELQGRHAHLKTRYTLAYENSVNNLDEQTARVTADEAFSTGSWTIEEYEAAMQNLGGDIDNTAWTMMLTAATQAGDVEGIEAIAENVFSHPTNRMSAPQKAALQAQAYNSKISIQKSAVTAAEKERKAASNKKLSELSMIVYSQGKMSWSLLEKNIAGMEPEHQRTIMTLNSNVDNGPPDSDPETVALIETMILNLGSPLDGADQDQRIAQVRAMVRAGTGQDPVTGEQIGPSLLDTKTIGRLNTMIDQTVARPFRNPRNDRVEDRIYRVITGADKSQFGINTDAQAKYRLNETLKRYHAAMDQAGDNFNAEQWYSTNVEQIEGETYQSFMASELGQKMRPYLVQKKDGVKITTNVSESRALILDAVADGGLDPDEAKKFINALEAMR